MILHANALAVVETKMLQVILPTRTKIGRKLKLVLPVKIERVACYIVIAAYQDIALEKKSFFFKKAAFKRLLIS